MADSVVDGVWSEAGAHRAASARRSRGARVTSMGFVFLSFLVTAACSVSTSDERELGAQQAAQVDSELPLVHDTAVEGFIATLGKSIASHTDRADLDWRFAVVNTAEVNAFALPGGFIYVNRGLIEQTDRLDELAGVMGHEIGHVVRRHSAKQIEASERRDVGLVLLCTLTRVCRSLGGRIAVQVGADAMAAKYSQQDELEADAEAVPNTLHAGIDPEGMPAFLEKLMDQQKEQPTAVQAFFSTHPTNEARITALRKRIASFGPLPKTLLRDTPDFHAMQARLRALPPPPPSNLTP